MNPKLYPNKKVLSWNLLSCFGVWHWGCPFPPLPWNHPHRISCRSLALEELLCAAPAALCLSGLAREPASLQHIVLPKQSKITAMSSLPCSAFFEYICIPGSKQFCTIHILLHVCIQWSEQDYLSMHLYVCIYIYAIHSLPCLSCRVGSRFPLRCITCADIKQHMWWVEPRHLYSRKIVANVAELSC